MKRLFTIVILGAGLLTGSAIAQSPGGDAPIAQRSIKITAEQGYIIKENVLTGGGTVGQQPSNADLEIGAKVPGEVQLKEFPQLVAQRVPAVRGFKYFVANNQVVIVSTSDNTVADILK